MSAGSLALGQFVICTSVPQNVVRSICTSYHSLHTVVLSAFTCGWWCPRVPSPSVSSSLSRQLYFSGRWTVSRYLGRLWRIWTYQQVYFSFFVQSSDLLPLPIPCNFVPDVSILYDLRRSQRDVLLLSFQKVLFKRRRVISLILNFSSKGRKFVVSRCGTNRYVPLLFRIIRTCPPQIGCTNLLLQSGPVASAPDSFWSVTGWPFLPLDGAVDELLLAQRLQAVSELTRTKIKEIRTLKHDNDWKREFFLWTRQQACIWRDTSDLEWTITCLISLITASLSWKMNNWDAPWKDVCWWAHDPLLTIAQHLVCFFHLVLERSPAGDPSILNPVPKNVIFWFFRIVGFWWRVGFTQSWFWVFTVSNNISVVTMKSRPCWAVSPTWKHCR